MDWIKKHYDQFALALLAVALIASSAAVAMNTLGFNEEFVAAKTPPPRKTKIPPLDMGKVGDAQQALLKPVAWSQLKQNGQLFVSWKYFLDPLDKKQVRPGSDPLSRTHPPVLDSWLIKHSLDLLSSNVLQEDGDKDGFTVLEEYLNGRKTADLKGESTDPKDSASHPGYHTKLYLKQYIKIPFRLLFQVHDGDPKFPEKMEFQINTLDLRQPTEFLKLGDTVKNTRFKLEKFEFKERMNTATKIMEDVSELTLLDARNGEHVVLVLAQVTDSPDSFALFSYQWPQPAIEFRVQKLGPFVLKPNLQEKYKLVDIKETEALIALPSGEKFIVPLLPK